MKDNKPVIIALVIALIAVVIALIVIVTQKEPKTCDELQSADEDTLNSEERSRLIKCALDEINPGY